jgi:rhamnogalacturonan endolyase
MRLLRSLISAGQVFLLLSITAAALAKTASDPPVTITDTGTNYILANGYITASISKTTGDMVSLKYHGLETMGYVSGHHAGYWEQNPSGAARKADTITIDPAKNNGERGEVSIKGWSDGQSLTAHPVPDPGTAVEDSASQLNGRHIGPPPGSGRMANAGTFVGRRPGRGGRGPGLLLDMEIRYTLARGDHGIYTYAIFTHEPAYGATSLGESRYGFKLNSQVFDWLSVDRQRNALMPTSSDWDNGTVLNMKEARRLTTGVYKGRAEHKYDYCADQFDTPAFGWSSTKDHIGLYFINPSMEYLSSGPDHFELTGHIDDGDGGDPTLLDYWRGTHYGGSELPVAAGEDWNKVVGPIFIYLDSAKTPDAMFREAKAQAVRESAKWPYSWVKDADYPQAAQRSTVSGQLILQDPQASSKKLPNLLIGLAYPDQTGDVPTSPRGFGPQRLTWQNDAKHYEFWARGSSDGRFTIPKVRPGTYELHAIADGVLGEYAKADVTVVAGQPLDLGKLDWKPVRYGKQLWQIGIPNRSASEFLKGDDHWHWGLYIEYSKLFPNDVDYTVGKSDFRKDWYIYQVPHVISDDGTGRSKGRATTWTIHFNMPATQPKGRATLRLALAGVSARSIEVGVNDKPAGAITGLIYNATINRDGIEGSWVEKDLSFDASLLRPGQNTLTLTVPAGGLTNGVSYDVVRLELASK